MVTGREMDIRRSRDAIYSQCNNVYCMCVYICVIVWACNVVTYLSVFSIMFICVSVGLCIDKSVCLLVSQSIYQFCFSVCLSPFFKVSLYIHSKLFSKLQNVLVRWCPGARMHQCTNAPVPIQIFIHLKIINFAKYFMLFYAFFANLTGPQSSHSVF